MKRNAITVGYAILICSLINIARAGQEPPPLYYTFDSNCGDFKCLTSYINDELIPQNSPYLQMLVIGQSEDAKPVYSFEITDFSIPESGKRHIFIVGRLHGAEYTQSYVIEGFVNNMINNTSDPDVAKLLASSHITVIPIANAYGANERMIRNSNDVELQTNWVASWNHSTEESEVRAIHDHLDQIKYNYGVDLVLNLHDPYRPEYGETDKGDYGWRFPSYFPNPFIDRPNIID